MVNTPLTRIAMRLCYAAHDGQLDKAGVPYVFHPIHVAEHMETEVTTCAALLHDVLEDTNTTAADLRAAGMPNEVVEAVELLSHPKGESYLEYVRRVAQNDIARAVKIADLTHNSDLTRLDVITERDLQRTAKYQAALRILRPE